MLGFSKRCGINFNFSNRIIRDNIRLHSFFEVESECGRFLEGWEDFWQGKIKDKGRDRPGWEAEFWESEYN